MEVVGIGEAMIITDTDGREIYVDPSRIESVVHGPPHGGAITTFTGMVVVVAPDIAEALLDLKMGRKTLADLASSGLIDAHTRKGWVLDENQQWRMVDSRSKYI